jgi:hypothetical protein
MTTYEQNGIEILTIITLSQNISQPCHLGSLFQHQGVICHHYQEPHYYKQRDG